MITNLILGADGRLGNQLFQYAALRALGLKNDYTVAIPDPKDREWHGQHCLLDEFRIPVVRFSPNRYGSFIPTYSYLEVDPFKIDKQFFSIPNGTNLQGYFQSLFYFEEFADQIKFELTPKQHHIDKAKEYVANLKKQKRGRPIVSVHIRRGDNTSIENPSKLPTNMMEDFCLPYYVRAKEYMIDKLDKLCFLHFTGGKRGTEDNSEDTRWCENQFIDSPVSKNASPLEDFCRIMCCDHHIVSHISSFGYWAAYLGLNPNKIVVAPERYHPDRPDYTHREKFYPEDWKLF